MTTDRPIARAVRFAAVGVTAIALLVGGIYGYTVWSDFQTVKRAVARFDPQEFSAADARLVLAFKRDLEAAIDHTRRNEWDEAMATAAKVAAQTPSRLQLKHARDVIDFVARNRP